MNIFGKIELPGDKSISHRALMLAGLAGGTSVIQNLPTGQDVNSTINCLKICGVDINKNNDSILVTGGTLSKASGMLECGNSGTTVRLLSGLLAGQGIESIFTGDNSLSQRPMRRIIDPLTQMGAKILSNSDKLPLKIIPSNLQGISYSPKVASAQVKSSILLAGLGAEGQTEVIEKIKTRDHTELLLKELGANLEITKQGAVVQTLSKPLENFEMYVPGDISSAAFFIAATLLVPGSVLVIKNVLLNEQRTGFIELIKKHGADIQTGNIATVLGEKIGDIVVKHSSLTPFIVTQKDIPAIIDEIPILAVLATQIAGESKISGASELRHKESDRIRAVYYNLKNLGADIQEFPDGFKIKGPCELEGTLINTFDDHRIAMSFAVAGLIAANTTILDNPECIKISFPRFLETLEGLIR